VIIKKVASLRISFKQITIKLPRLLAEVTAPSEKGREN
jgi:hypothetical protein